VNSTKPWYKSKTFWVGTVILVAGLLSFAQDDEWIKQFPQVVKVLGTIGGVLMVVLRFVTKQPISWKK